MWWTIFKTWEYEIFLVHAMEFLLSLIYECLYSTHQGKQNTIQRLLQQYLYSICLNLPTRNIQPYSSYPNLKHLIRDCAEVAIYMQILRERSSDTNKLGWWRPDANSSSPLQKCWFHRSWRYLSPASQHGHYFRHWGPQVWVWLKAQQSNLTHLQHFFLHCPF